MNRELVRHVWERAEHRCEYCRIPYPAYRLPFQIDHVIARQHGGDTVAENLALCCLHCNRHKGPNLAGWDNRDRKMQRLFNPRTDVWEDHFELRGYRIDGKTRTGRVTVHVLAMNADDLLSLRAALIIESGRL